MFRRTTIGDEERSPGPAEMGVRNDLQPSSGRSPTGRRAHILMGGSIRPGRHPVRALQRLGEVCGWWCTARRNGRGSLATRRWSASEGRASWIRDPPEDVGFTMAQPRSGRDAAQSMGMLEAVSAAGPPRDIVVFKRRGAVRGEVSRHCRGRRPISPGDRRRPGPRQADACLAFARRPRAERERNPQEKSR